MRRSLPAVALLFTAVACAHVEPPSGGPEDRSPPQLLAVRPDTFAVVPGWQGPVVFQFDEGISEQGIEQAVSVSPRTSSVVAEKSGDQLRVRLRGGWERGRIYHVHVEPAIQDRFNNRRSEPIRLVFSTGPAIPATRVTGKTLDRVTGQPVRDARVEAVLRPDSLVYATRSDSAGRFEFRQIPEGAYLLRAYQDQNQSRTLEPFEPRDTAVLAVSAAVGAPEVRLALLAPDSTPPSVGTALLAEGWVEVKFDDFLDPDQEVTPAQVALLGPDGARVPVAGVRIGAAAQGTAGDTARPAPPPLAPGAAADAVGPVPSQSLFIRPAVDLVPDTTYRVQVMGVRNLVGLVGGGEAAFDAPRVVAPPPAAPADTAPASAPVAVYRPPSGSDLPGSRGRRPTQNTLPEPKP